jgi:hydroxyacylglutathione hydrolase
MVVSTPGHTKKSVCYYQQPQENFQPVLWTGDTLFIGGCGRVFETDMTTMWQSLNKLKKLPRETIICPGHDYTEENYRFALTVEPGNEKIQAALSKWKQEKPASSILQAELKTNIFLKAKNAEEFAKLRRAKDVY